MEFRKSHLDAFVKKYGIKLGFMSVFSKAAAYALQDQPVVNAVIEGQVNVTSQTPLEISLTLNINSDLKQKKTRKSSTETTSTSQ